MQTCIQQNMAILRFDDGFTQRHVVGGRRGVKVDLTNSANRLTRNELICRESVGGNKLFYYLIARRAALESK